LALTVPLSGQEPPAPRYPAQATAIVVDVVVDDAHGQPVRGLTKDDFTVLEDGKPQPIVGFEVHDVRAETKAAAEAPEPAAAVATNAGPLAQPGRVLALLIDDLGISAPVAGQLKPALADWIARHAKPRDEITIMTTSGSIWWSDVVETGRDDLLTVLGRVQGKLLAGGGGGEEMTDAEAYRIDVLEQSTEFAVPNAARSRPTDAVGIAGGGVKFVGNSATERVVQRWLESHVCPPCTDRNESPIDCREIRQCFQRVRMRATEIHTGAARRTAAVLGAISRLSKGLAAARGRKSILVVSEALVHDASLGVPFRDAIDAAQRANTSLYFLDARGLAGASFQEAAASSQPPRGQDLAAMSVEEGVLAVGGGESLADETGGRLTRSNDLAAGLERMADDSSVYYLLGYQPEKPPDGGWHKLEVKVARSGVEVRARRGYRALRPQDLERAAKQQVEAARTSKEPRAARVGKRPLAPALLAGSARGSLALRLSTYVMDTNGAGAARAQVALEIDNSQVQVDRSATPWTASLDLSILAAGLFHPPIVPVDERLDLTLRPGDVGNGWWLVSRDVWLQPGVWQVRVLVKDVASGHVGLVAQRIEVPDVDQPYLSTPLLSDRTLPALRPGEPPRLVPTARRRFEPRGTLYCQYEVFSYGGLALAGVPQLFGGYTLERSSGTVVSEAAPTMIDAADGRHAVRRIALPLDGLEPGPYFLALLIQDRLTGKALTARTGFEVLPQEAVPTAR
jgi:VWFA-related protein